MEQINSFLSDVLTLIEGFLMGTGAIFWVSRLDLPPLMEWVLGLGIVFIVTFLRLSLP